MNLDPLTIILFLIFFVLPIVNNFLRRGQGGQGGQGQQGRGSQGRPQRPTGPPQRRERSDDNTSADTNRDGGGVGDEFTRRLDDARRRVQEAMSSGSDGGTGSQRQSQSDQGSSSDLFPRLDDERQARSQQGQRSQQGRSQQGQLQGRGGGARQPFEGLGREGVSRQRPASQQGVATKQSSVSRTELGDAPPLRVQRLKPRKSSKLDKSRGVLEFDRRSVLQGIIWREILDEPLSKRKRRKRL